MCISGIFGISISAIIIIIIIPFMCGIPLIYFITQSATENRLGIIADNLGSNISFSFLGRICLKGFLLA